MHTDLAHRTRRVTRATAGIGRASALALAERGADVVVHGRDPGRGAATVVRITALGGSARFEPADLSNPADATRLAERAGDVDILVDNARIFRFARTADISRRSWRVAQRSRSDVQRP